MNLFEKDFLIVPINKNNSHWYIVIICYPYLAEPVYAESPIKSERVEIKFENTNLDLTNTITNNTNNNDQRKTRSATAAERVSIDSKNSFDSEEADEAEEDDSNFSTIFNNENKENNKICTKM